MKKLNIILVIIAVIAFIGTMGFKSFFIKHDIKAGKAGSSESAITSQQDWESGEYDASLDTTTSPGSIKISTEQTKLDLKSIATLSTTSHSDTAALSIDNDTNTSWIATQYYGTTDLAWLYVDLGSVCHLTKAREIIEMGLFDLSASLDGVTYNAIEQPQSWGPTPSWVDINFTGDYRYFKIGLGSAHGPTEPDANYYLYEFELYGKPVSATHTTGATQIDGGENFWSWDSNTIAQTVPANTSTSYQYRTSPDGSTWTSWVGDISSVTNRTGDDSDNPTRYRYLQIKATLTNTDGTSTPTIDQYDIGYHTEVKPTAPSAQTATVE